ncbi:MAG TPA: hypothetical protein VKG38_18625 [Solirubrobacteraceae bacterium]|nr:hypothetical protein [Solirubrobacteraceae bacterium]
MSAPAVPTPLAPYESLLAHAELELELAGRGDVEGLLELGRVWERLIAALPHDAPPGAAVLLERASLIRERGHIELLRLQELLLGELATVRRARSAAAGYAGASGAQPRLERSA